MDKYLCLTDYEAATAATRDERMAWWREARFGMFVHYGLYALYGRNEWVMALENIPIPEYEKQADRFAPKPNCPREWAQLASEAGMKYMVMTTKHHEGFCLWDTKQTDYNSCQRGPKRDIVAEYVEACREFGLKIGFYYSLMDWHHPDGWRCVHDEAAAERFRLFTRGCVRELMSSYGTIDVLWYDVSAPFDSHEGWGSRETNQMARELQPNLIINNRSKLDEDFGTPEGRVQPLDRDWEACMTFNGLSWGYTDSKQALPDSYNVRGILKMIHTACSGGGNLLLNIGPMPDGSVPEEAVKPLQDTGTWLAKNAEVIYGEMQRGAPCIGRWGQATIKGHTIYYWTSIWPDGEAGLGGLLTPVKTVRFLDGTPIEFEQADQRIVFKNLPQPCPDEIANRVVMALEFDEPPQIRRCSKYPQLHSGHVY